MAHRNLRKKFGIRGDRRNSKVNELPKGSEMPIEKSGRILNR